MSIAFDDDGHVRRAAGLYYVGHLGDEEQMRVEAHLAGCRTCLDEYGALGEVVFSLSFLPDDSIGEDDGADRPEPLDPPDGWCRPTEEPAGNDPSSADKSRARDFAIPAVRFVIAHRPPAARPRPATPP